MQFNQLSLKHRPIFNKSLSYKQHNLSAYAFENIFIWRGLYKIFWAKINNCLCVFFKDRIGCFLYLPPLGRNFNPTVVHRCFEIMNRHNKNKAISRIENVEKHDTSLFKKLGLEIILGSQDYVCKKADLVRLKGNNFKSKRAAANHFRKNYAFQYRPYRNADKKQCLDLFKLWSGERKLNNKDEIYQSLLDDNLAAFKTALGSYSQLRFQGRIVRINNKLQAATFGYALDRKVFVVLFEVCNLKFKGVAQHIFREFCREQSCPDINIMDDSGLNSLRKVKMSYRPYKTIDNFIVRNE